MKIGQLVIPAIVTIIDFAIDLPGKIIGALLKDIPQDGILLNPITVGIVWLAVHVGTIVTILNYLKK